MAAPPASQGKGILFVNSKISRPDILDVPTFMKWYDEDHISEVIETSGIRSARRFINSNTNVDMPYLAMYPMDDLGFVKGEEFRKITVTGDILPDNKTIYDLAEMDVRNDTLVCVHDVARRGKGAVKSLVTIAVEPKGGAPSEEFYRWFREGHCASLAQYKGYLRTTGFKLVFARTNAQSRVLKGLSPPTYEPPSQPPSQPPTWLSLHEFGCTPEELNEAEIRKLVSSPWGDDGFAKFEFNIYKLVKEFGEKDWFYDVEL